MTHNIRISGNSIILTVSTIDTGYILEKLSLSIVNRFSKIEKIVTPELNLDENNNIVSIISVFDFDCSVDELFIICDGKKESVLSLFDRYILDANKLSDYLYINEKLVNAGTRNISGDELFYICLCYYDKLAPENCYLGAIISIISYRIAENIPNRQKILPDLLAVKSAYDKNAKFDDAHHIRWFFSSTNALSSLLIAIGDLVNAKNIIEISLKKSAYVGLNPLCYWNFSSILFKHALLKFEEGNNREAGTYFLMCFNNARAALSDLLHPRNDWVFNQFSDCRAVLDLAEHALIGATAAFNGKIPGETRFMNIRALRPVFNAELCLDRFPSLKNKKNVSFQKLSDCINSQIKSIK